MTFEHQIGAGWELPFALLFCASAPAPRSEGVAFAFTFACSELELAGVRRFVPSQIHTLKDALQQPAGLASETRKHARPTGGQFHTGSDHVQTQRRHKQSVKWGSDLACSGMCCVLSSRLSPEKVVGAS